MSLECLCASMVQPTALLPREHPQGRLVPSHPLNSLYPLATGGTVSDSGCWVTQAVTVAALVGRGSSRAGSRILSMPGYLHIVSAGTVAAQAAQQHVGLLINRIWQSCGWPGNKTYLSLKNPQPPFTSLVAQCLVCPRHKHTLLPVLQLTSSSTGLQISCGNKL